MALWLRRTKTGLYSQTDTCIEYKPCPTIMAAGIGGVCRSQYWLEDDMVASLKRSVDKPPYRVPSMEEIRAIPWNGFNVVSTFSGTGGSCLGYRMAGYRVLWANEFVPAAQESYKANHPDSVLDPRDIRNIKPKEVLNTIRLAKGDIDLFDGSPPCASFSVAGSREKGWGKTKIYSDVKQRTDDLFFEYARLLNGLQPKVFVAENVSGLLKGSAKGYFLIILKALKECGYNVKCKLLDAQWLGVPQMRQRAIFVGVRNDLEINPAFPSPLSFRYSVKDAIPWIKTINKKGGNYVDLASQPHLTIQATDAHRKDTAQFSATGWVESETDISKYAIGSEFDNLKEGEQSSKYFQLVRAHRNKPSNTITVRGGCNSSASVVHPTEKRKFSIAELKRICAFPDDFILKGSYFQQWERLGRSVPPVMMMHIAKAIEENILKKIQ